MNLALLLESMKIHKIKQEKEIRILFVVCYLVNIAAYFIPGSDPDLAGLVYFLNELAKSNFVVPTFTQGNLVFLGLLLVSSLLNLLLLFTYASIYAGEYGEKTVKDAVRGVVRSLPSLGLALFLMIVPSILSLFTLMLPLIIISTMMYFLPLNLILGEMKLPDAVSSSYNATKNMKFIIFFQNTLLVLLLNLAENFILALFDLRGLGAVLLSGFFIGARTMMAGRLMGLLYLNLVKKVPIVLTSKTNA